jgi:hypothetical protein
VMIFTIFLESYFYDGCCRRNGGRIFILHLFVMDEQFRDLLMFGAPVLFLPCSLNSCYPIGIPWYSGVALSRLREILITKGLKFFVFCWNVKANVKCNYKYRNWVKYSSFFFSLFSFSFVCQLLRELGCVDVNDKLNPILMKRRILFLLFPLSMILSSQKKVSSTYEIQVQSSHY